MSSGEAPETAALTSEPPPLELDLVDGVVLAGLLAAIVVAERYDAARATFAAVRDAGGSVGPVRPAWVPWVLIIVVGALCALGVIARLAQEVEARGGNDGHRAGMRVRQLAYLALGFWVAWQI